MVKLNPNVSEFRKNLKQSNYDKLSGMVRPQYYQLFQNLGRVKDGVHTLVKIRHDLLTMLEEKSKLCKINTRKAFIFLFILDKHQSFYIQCR
jgi:hypothetical protein